MLDSLFSPRSASKIGIEVDLAGISVSARAVSDALAIVDRRKIGRVKELVEAGLDVKRLLRRLK